MVNNCSWSKSVNPSAMENVPILEACNGYLAVDLILAAVIFLYRDGATVS